MYIYIYVYMHVCIHRIHLLGTHAIVPFVIIGMAPNEKNKRHDLPSRASPSPRSWGLQLEKRPFKGCFEGRPRIPLKPDTG